MREYRVTLGRMQRGQRAVPPIPERGNDHLGLRTKLGGKPDWIQNDDRPDCPECGDAMWFVAQIDPIEHNSKHNRGA